MSLEQIILGASTSLNVAIGLAVYLANVRRSQNFQFFLFAINMSLWGVLVFNITVASEAVEAANMIRAASFASCLIPLTFYQLCLSIKHPTETFWGLLKRSSGIIILTQVAGIMTFTPYYLHHAVIPDAAASGNAFPEAHYGPLFIPYNLCIFIAFGYTMFHFVRQAKQAQGIQRVEYQFIVLGMATTVLMSLATQFILPALTASSQSQALGPAGVTMMNAIVAYGIATKRLMGIADIIRRIAAYSLVTIYLTALYVLIFFLTDYVANSLLNLGWDSATHLLCALVVAFSVAPAHGRMQNFANKLFLNQAIINVGSTVQRASEFLQSISTLDEMLSKFTGVISESIGTDSIQVHLSRNGSFEQVFPPPLEGAPPTLQADDPLVQMVMNERNPIVTETIQRSRQTPEVRAVANRMKELRVAIAVGIRSKGEFTGIMLLGPRVSGRIYGAVEQDTLQILSNNLAVAIENSSLYTQVQDSKVYNDILVDSLVSGVVAVDENRRVSVINREAQRITGLTAESCIMKPIEILPPPLREALEETFNTRKELRDRDLYIAQADDPHETPIRLGSTIFLNQKGEPLGALLVFNDLTAIRKLETQVRRTDRLASLGTMSAGMAHEIKNPLVTIKTFTELLPERFNDDDFRDTFASLVGQEVLRIDGIVNQLLRFARPAKPTLRPMHIHECIEKTTGIVGQQLLKQTIKLEINLNAESDTIHGDMSLLEQSFINFFLNAVDAMEPHGKLTISTDQVHSPRYQDGSWNAGADQPHIRIRISDTGAGIDPEDVPHVFDPFFTTKSEGTGLGLSVSHGIIQEHNGAVDVESEVGAGTTFVLTFPLIRKEAIA